MIAVCMMLITSYTMAQTVLTLEDCRAMALENNGQSKMAKEKVNAAEYDSKAAFANYLPKVSATGMYLHNSENINLISDEQSGTLSTIGTRVQNGVQSFITDPNIMGLITSTDPAVRNAATAMFTKMSAMDIEGTLNQLGQDLSDDLSLDIQNVYVGMITVEEPL